MRESRPHWNQAHRAWQVVVPAELSSTGKPRRRYFQDQAEAEALAQQINGERGLIRTGFHQLPQSGQAAILRCLHRVHGDASQIEEALDAWLRQRNLDRSMTVGVVCDECVASRQSAGRRASYWKNLRNTLRHFRAGRESKPLVEVTVAEIEDWLNGSGWATATRQGFLKDVRTLFSFAIKRGYLKANPAENLDRPLDDEDQPARVMPVGDIEKLLRRAASSDPALARWIAVQVFGGLRKSEAVRLKEADLRPGYIFVSAKTKTRTKRFAPIHPTLAEWLKLPGTLPLKNLVRRFRRIRGTLQKHQSKRGTRLMHTIDILVPRNALRVSYCSYGCQALGPKRTAEGSGHDEDVLFAEYRETVTPEEAARFWAILPP